MQRNNSKGFEAGFLIVSLAVIGTLCAAGYMVIVRSKKPNKLPPVSQNQQAKTEEIGLDNLPTTNVIINPVGFQEFDTLVKTPPTTLQPAYNAKPASLSDAVNTTQLQSVILKQSDSTVKIYVGRLRELSVGKFQLLTAFELRRPADGDQSLIGVSENSAERHLEFDSQTVVAWTNLPEEHEYAKAIRNFEASGLE